MMKRYQEAKLGVCMVSKKLHFCLSTLKGFHIKTGPGAFPKCSILVARKLGISVDTRHKHRKRDAFQH